jgi:hypothetical protein
MSRIADFQVPRDHAAILSNLFRTTKLSSQWNTPSGEVVIGGKRALLMPSYGTLEPLYAAIDPILCWA